MKPKLEERKKIKEKKKCLKDKVRIFNKCSDGFFYLPRAVQRPKHSVY